MTQTPAVARTWAFLARRALSRVVAPSLAPRAVAPSLALRAVSPSLAPHAVAPSLALLVLVPWACTPNDPARAVVHESIQIHGGDRFESMDVRFTFRDVRFRMVQDGGRYLYERVLVDPAGPTVREWMTNEGTGREVDGTPRPLDPESRARVETAVNSVVYFGFLPFRLLDPAARHRELPSTHILGEPYRVVEVTFQEEGGGQDWEDRFVYWFHEQDGTLDYLAYRYHRDGGGTRFRRAVNRREVGGLTVQDYENFGASGGVDDIARYPELYEAGELSLLSMVELRDVTVDDPPPGWPAEAHPGSEPEANFPEVSP